MRVRAPFVTGGIRVMLQRPGPGFGRGFPPSWRLRAGHEPPRFAAMTHEPA